MTVGVCIFLFIVKLISGFYSYNFFKDFTFVKIRL